MCEIAGFALFSKPKEKAPVLGFKRNGGFQGGHLWLCMCSGAKASRKLRPQGLNR